MKRKIIGLLASAAILAASGAYAGNQQPNRQVAPKLKVTKPQAVRQQPRAVPEIDVTAGTQAGALILGTLLLVAERSRRRAAPSAR